MALRDLLRRGLRAMVGRKGTAAVAAPPPAGRNWDSEALRSEFKRRYLTEFARYVAVDMVASHDAAISFATLVAVIGGSLLGGPVGLLLGGGLALRHIAIRRDLAGAVIAAGKGLSGDLESGAAGNLAGVEAWLDRHEQDLPGYLDKLDRVDDELRLVRRIIERLNRAMSLASLTRDERRLLARHGYRRLTLPIQVRLRLPPRCALGNWHSAQLSRSLWRDVTQLAGDRGRPLKRLLGLARLSTRIVR